MMQFKVNTSTRILTKKLVLKINHGVDELKCVLKIMSKWEKLVKNLSKLEVQNDFDPNEVQSIANEIGYKVCIIIRGRYGIQVPR